MTDVAAPIIVKAGARGEMVGFIVTTIFILIFITVAVAVAIYARYVVSNITLVISTISVVSLLCLFFLLRVRSWSRNWSASESAFWSGVRVGVLLLRETRLPICTP